ncbi:hypothetical protein LshimejAT787_1702000 [Lyophyllum shimeji]|uniref:HMG box domain-containing protein n=1 Tax=Lyophyllum shimeji TaxID=47721 RepID=A0A9P3UTF6_LYOSH|nr:hypothetical protein LshimejAT787_1702000 [Lyophyllum shimeji]
MPAASRQGHLRDLDYIPRPPNSFMLFLSTTAAKLKVSAQIRKTVELSKPAGFWDPAELTEPRRKVPTAKMAADLWDRVPDAVRVEYARAAELRKQKHAQKYPGYKYKPMTKAMKAEAKEEAKKAKAARIKEARVMRKSQKSNATAPCGPLEGLPQEAPSFFVPSHNASAVDSATAYFDTHDSIAALDAAHRATRLSTTGGPVEHTRQSGTCYPQPTYEFENGQVLQACQSGEAKGYEGSATGTYMTFNLPLPYDPELEASAQREIAFQNALQDFFGNGGASVYHSQAQMPLAYDAQAPAQHDLSEVPEGPFELQMGSFDMNDFDISHWANLNLGQWTLGGDFTQGASEYPNMCLAAPASTSTANPFDLQPSPAAVTYGDHTSAFAFLNF